MSESGVFSAENLPERRRLGIADLSAIVSVVVVVVVVALRSVTHFGEGFERGARLGLGPQYKTPSRFGARSVAQTAGHGGGF